MPIKERLARKTSNSMIPPRPESEIGQSHSEIRWALSDIVEGRDW